MVLRRAHRILIILACAIGATAALGGWLVFRDGHTKLLPPVADSGEEETGPRRRTGPPLDPRSLLFRECASEAGITFRMRSLPNEQGETFKINLYDHGSGVAVGDFDGDGHDDIYFCNQLGPNALYRNRGDGTFTEVAQKAGVALGDRVCVGASFVDYDNDGRMDLFVTSTRGGNVLFHNLGGGRFQDVAKQAGLSHVGHSQVALFFDYDNDGFLDLFLGNTAQWTSETFDKNSHYFLGKGDLGFSADAVNPVPLSPKEPNILYHNNGDGTFTEVTTQAGVTGRGWAGDAAAFDYNDDGRLDLMVTSMFGRCQLYRNNGDGTFTDVTLEVLGQTPWGGLGVRVFDYNNDGRLDLLIVDMHSDMWMGLDHNHYSLPLARKYEKKKFRYSNGPHAAPDSLLLRKEMEFAQRIGFRHEEVLFGNALFRNEGGGKFTEVSDQAGVETFWPWGIAAADFDNDGYEDIFMPCGMGFPFYYWPNYLLMNQGDGTFRDRAEESGIEPPLGGIYQPEPIAGLQAARSSRSAATGDFDGDGRLEIVTNNFNGQPYYFKNQKAKKDYLAFRLQGIRSNRDAFGAEIRLYQGKRVLTRQLQAAGGYLSQSSKTVHFGLADGQEVDRVEIKWPSGVRQILRGKDVAVNTVHTVVEPVSESDQVK
jgi:enediyne biosynthesis protein E4